MASIKNENNVKRKNHKFVILDISIKNISVQCQPSIITKIKSPLANSTAVKFYKK